MKKKLDAIETWLYRRIIKTARTEDPGNAEIIICDQKGGFCIISERDSGNLCCRKYRKEACRI